MKVLSHICRLALCSFINLKDVPLGRNSLEKNYMVSGRQSDKHLSSFSQLSPFIVIFEYIILGVITAYYSLTKMNELTLYNEKLA